MVSEVRVSWKEISYEYALERKTYLAHVRPWYKLVGLSTRTTDWQEHVLSEFPRLDASHTLRTIGTSSLPLHAFMSGHADDQDAAGDYRLVDETTVCDVS